MGKRRYAKRGSAAIFVNDVIMKWDSDECLLWPFGTDAKGYASYQWPGYSTGRLSRALCDYENGAPPSPKHQAAHKCGVSGCVNRHHLYWATQKQNEADKIKHGTALRGESNPNSRFTREEVRQIRNLRKTHKCREIAELFSIPVPTVSTLCNKSWAWLD